jgi:hypothetical protein
MVRRFRLLVAVCVLAAVADLQGQVKRPLAIEDHYRVLTITNPQIAPDGKSVRFSVTTRVESDNSTRTESFSVPADGSAPPTKIATAGGAGSGGAATGSGQGRGGLNHGGPRDLCQLSAFSLQLSACSSQVAAVPIPVPVPVHPLPPKGGNYRFLFLEIL